MGDPGMSWGTKGMVDLGVVQINQPGVTRIFSYTDSANGAVNSPISNTTKVIKVPLSAVQCVIRNLAGGTGNVTVQRMTDGSTAFETGTDALAPGDEATIPVWGNGNRALTFPGYLKVVVPSGATASVGFDCLTPHGTVYDV